MGNFNVVIESFPEADILPVGTDVRFQAHIDHPENIPQGAQFQWSCENDLSTLPAGRSTVVHGPSGLAWSQAEWAYPGDHTIIFTIRSPNGQVRRIAKRQTVAYAKLIAQRELNVNANDSDPTPSQQLIRTEKYLETLKQVAAERPPGNSAQQRAYDDRVEYLESYTEHLRNHLSELGCREGFPVDAIHVDKNSGQRTQLKLWLVNVTDLERKDEDWIPWNDGDKTWKLIDWTNPAHRSTTGVYEGSGDSHEQAVRDVFNTWDSDNRYPEGYIEYSLTTPDKYGINLSGGFESDGQSFWDEVSAWLDYVALGAAVVAGVATMVVPGSQAISVAIWVSIFASTGAATTNIVSRHQEGFGNWRDDAFDGLSIVGNIFGGAAWKLGATISSSALLSAQRTVLIGQLGTDGLQGILLGEQYLSQYNSVVDDPNLGPEERLQKLMEVFRSALVAGVLTTVSISGTRADLSNLNNNRTLLNAQDLATEGTVIDLDAAVEPNTQIADGQSRLNARIEHDPGHPPLEQQASRSARSTLNVVDDFENRHYSYVQRETSRIIDLNDALGTKKAISGAGHPDLPIEAGVYWNIEGKRPIVNRMVPSPNAIFGRLDGVVGKYTIPDIESYMEHLKGIYKKDPFYMVLHPEMERKIREHIEVNDRVLLDEAGPPGMHAEVLAVNQLFHRMDSAGIPINQENLGKISVATFYVQGNRHRGNHFPACNNCGGILSEPISIRTGRSGVSDE